MRPDHLHLAHAQGIFTCKQQFVINSISWKSQIGLKASTIVHIRI